MSKDKPMTERASSMIAAHHYDPDNRELTLDFKNGGRYVVEEVAADKFAGFEHAQSPGRFFLDNMRNNPAHNIRKVK